MGEVRLREKDDFKSLAVQINEFKRKWRSRFQQIDLVVRKLETGAPPTQTSDLKELKTILAGFKTGEIESSLP